mmetsp:Transcript_23622/g.57230  ORF Transcript_23622/g.57230 Transcript_23622/m.57230 type:complete len:288 (+) Transcript_23622:299-1162(+)
MYSGKKRKVQITYHSQPPRIWYKDQAHEPKFFDVTLVLRDERGNKVKGFDIPLKADLSYDNGRDVNRQDILKLSKDSVPKIDKTGIAELKIRIDSVSKNHDNHDFKVKISADASYVPEALDVTPACSQPITVRSKKNRGKRRKAEAGIGPDAFKAVASWCKYANDVMKDLSKRDTCQACGYLGGTHAQSCKIHKLVIAFKSVRPLLDGKSVEPKRQRTDSPLRFPPTPSRMSSDDFKRHRSPALALDNIHNISLPNANVTDGIGEFFGAPGFVRHTTPQGTVRRTTR